MQEELAAINAKLDKLISMFDSLAEVPTKPHKKPVLDPNQERVVGALLAAWYQRQPVGWLTTAQVSALGLPGAPEGSPRVVGRELRRWEGIRVRGLGDGRWYCLRSKTYHNQAVWSVERLA